MVTKVRIRRGGSSPQKYLTIVKTENYPFPCAGVIEVGLRVWATVGPKTAAGITEKIDSLDPPGRSNMGPFFFGDSSLS